MLSRFRNIKHRTLLSVIGLTLVASILFVHPSYTLAQSANRSRAINIIKQAANVFAKGDMAQTIKLCRQAIALDPNYPRAYNWLGAAQQRRGDRAGACGAFSKAVKLAPKTEDGTRAMRGSRELKCAGATTAPKPKPTPRPTQGEVETPVIVPTATPTPIPTLPPISIKIESNWNSPAAISSLAFSPDGFRIIGSLADGTWRLWKTKGGELDKLDRGDNSAGTAVASGRNSYAYGTGKGAVYLFDGRDGRKTGQLDARSGSVYGLAYSPDGESLVVAGMDNAIKIFDVRSKALLETIGIDNASISGAVFSPNGRQLAIGYGSDVRIYSTSSWKMTEKLQGDGLPVGAVAWSRDGSLIAASSGYKIRVWDAKTYQLLHTLTGHTLAVTALAFGNDSLLASGGFDAQLRLWNASEGASVGNFSFHNTRIRGLAFDALSKRLVSGDQNGSIAVWRLP